jgi:hypothetical protein
VLAHPAPAIRERHHKLVGGTIGMTARSASRRVIAPPAPDPRIEDGSTSPSARIRRTTGDITTPLETDSAGADEAVGAGDGDSGANTGVSSTAATSTIGLSETSGALVPLSSMTATRAPVWTVSPSSAKIWVNTPAAGDGISESTLSVDTSKSGSSRATTSPTFLNH